MSLAPLVHIYPPIVVEFVSDASQSFLLLANTAFNRPSTRSHDDREMDHCIIPKKLRPMHILPGPRDRLHSLTVLFPSGVVVHSVRDRCGYLLSFTPRQTEKSLAIECSLSHSPGSKYGGKVDIATPVKLDTTDVRFDRVFFRNGPRSIELLAKDAAPKR